MNGRRRLWAWLSNSDTQKTLAFLGSGLTVVVVAAWQLYLYVAERQPPGKSPGSSIVATGPVNVYNGITPEKHEEILKRREQEIRDELAQTNIRDKQRVALLERQLADTQTKLHDPEPALEAYKAKLAEAYEVLDKFKQYLPPNQLELARKALTRGDTEAAERLFRQVLSASTQEAAEAAYQLGSLAKSGIHYAEAYKYYRQAAQLQPDNPLYLGALGDIRITIVVDHYRKTGDMASRLPELQQADAELAASSDGFIRRGNREAAALSLIKRGNISRYRGLYGSQQPNHWQQAINFYQRAYDLALQAKHLPYLAEATIGLAQAKAGRGEFGDAAVHIERALHLSGQIEDKKYLSDSLNQLASIQSWHGDFATALQTQNRALAVAEAMHDDLPLLYGYNGRAGVYEDLSAKSCDYQWDWEVCDDALQRAQADYERTLALARKLGYPGLANWTEESLWRVEQRRKLAEQGRELMEIRERLDNNLQLRLSNPKEAPETSQ
jgi:tetratricopeptide (TPR) repeat protein